MSRTVIIGGGPGGYTAAFKLALGGEEVVLIEREKVGGTCLQVGCIPTKAYYKSAQLYSTLKDNNDLGVSGEFSLHLPTVVKRKDEIVASMTLSLEKQLKSYKNIKVLYGEGRFVDENSIQVGDEIIDFQQAIIATGSKNKMNLIKGWEHPLVIDSTQLLQLTELPKRLLVIGAGAVGLELADIFRSFGSEVSVAAYEFMPGFDEDIVKRSQNLLKRRGVSIYSGFEALEITGTESEVTVRGNWKNSEKLLVADLCLMAIGRGPDVESLSLENATVAYSSKGIPVNEKMMTSVKYIYAVGDVVEGVQQLAHVASTQGEYVASLILGEETEKPSWIVPACMYTHHEVAMAGLTQEECIEKKLPYISVKTMYRSNGKAVTLGETEGFIKLIAHKDKGTLLGIHILGSSADNLVMESVVAMDNNLTVKDLSKTIHPHPTLSEVFKEALDKLEEVLKES